MELINLIRSIRQIGGTHSIRERAKLNADGQTWRRNANDRKAVGGGGLFVAVPPIRKALI